MLNKWINGQMEWIDEQKERRMDGHRLRYLSNLIGRAEERRYEEMKFEIITGCFIFF